MSGRFQHDDALPAGARHLAELAGPLRDLHAQAARVDVWGRRLTDVLVRGGRLLAAGNGGSAAEAQHLTSELVGRYRDDRPPFSAIALHAETSATTAIANDYGVEEVFAPCRPARPARRPLRSRQRGSVHVRKRNRPARRPPERSADRQC
jgi:D-sedoheptulose 7-phosphate isomerase